MEQERKFMLHVTNLDKSSKRYSFGRQRFLNMIIIYKIMNIYKKNVLKVFKNISKFTKTFCT